MISKRDAERVRQRVRSALREKNRNGWSDRFDNRQGEGSVDWIAISQAVVERFGDRLSEIRWTLSESCENSTTKAFTARSLTYALLMPYLDLRKYSSTSMLWINSSVALCTNSFTSSTSSRHLSQSFTYSEQLIRGSIIGVLGRICQTVADVFGESILLDLPFEGEVIDIEWTNGVALWRRWRKQRRRDGVSSWRNSRLG